MAKKKAVDPDPSEALLRSREKRKWQIAFRRYVIESNPSQSYAPYFGLDIKNIRLWFEYQLTPDIGWQDFGSKWQFNHIIPVTYFNFSEPSDLRLCWNFVNIRAEVITDREPGTSLDLLGAKGYFKELFDASGNTVAGQLLDKIASLENKEKINNEGQLRFINEKKDFLKQISGYTVNEFEMINRGRSPQEVEKEMAILKKFSN
ncbi:MAG: hypothetical protein EOO13_12635 [Chitinophagaceae bacterium]|nr:MAG: hypothetical protein EOO13_12635 [Chitinophagaceae bacterium]